MSKLSTSVDVVDAMRHITMRISFKRTVEMQWRMRCALWLLCVAAWVLNCGIEFDGDKDGQ